MSSKKTIDISIRATLLLIVMICAVFLFASMAINQQATEACFSTLDDAAAQVTASIQAIVRNDCEELEVIADLLTQHDSLDSDIVRRHLASFQQRGTISVVGLLLPDGRLILGGEEETVREELDYSAELAKVPYVSGAVTPQGEDSARVYYQAVPVIRDGETVAILYGFVDLADLAAGIPITAFDGRAQVFVTDGETGDFLVDTWHPALGNTFDEEIMSRKVKPGYDYHRMKEDFTQGRRGRVAFWSNTAGEYFYSCYIPAGVNRWMVQLAVLESVVFDDVIRIRHVLCIVAAAEVLAFAVYFLWVISRVRKDTAQKNQRLSQTLYMYDVQQTLFDAYKSPELFTSALRKTARMLKADTSFFLALSGDAIQEVFFYPPKSQPDDNPDAIGPRFPAALERLTSGRSVLLYPEELAAIAGEEDRARLARRGIESLMLAPVLNSDGRLVGALGCTNMKRRWQDATLLECVSRNFLMALSNMRFYRQLELSGATDALTGLRNRNCYERALEALAAGGEARPGCLYIDANGLHELNNTLGHASGDAMLVCIGEAMRACFPQENCYRIGGDEFVVLCTGLSREELHRRADRISRQVEGAGYRISIGEAWLDGKTSGADALVKAAEKRMYQAKRLYYQQTGNLARARFMSRWLGQEEEPQPPQS